MLLTKAEQVSDDGACAAGLRLLQQRHVVAACGRFSGEAAISPAEQRWPLCRIVLAAMRIVASGSADPEFRGLQSSAGCQARSAWPTQSRTLASCGRALRVRNPLPHRWITRGGAVWRWRASRPSERETRACRRDVVSGRRRNETSIDTSSLPRQHGGWHARRSATKAHGQPLATTSPPARQLGPSLDQRGSRPRCSSRFLAGCPSAACRRALRFDLGDR